MRDHDTTISTIAAKSCLLLILMSGFTIDAQADTSVGVLQRLQGTVMIDQGDGFAIAHDGDAVYQGDRVLVMQASTGMLINDGCSLQLDRNSLHTLRDQQPCHGDGHVVRSLGPLYAAAIGVIKPKAEPEEPEPEAIEKPPSASQPDTSQSTTPEQPGDTTATSPSGQETDTATTTAARPSSNAIMIGVGVAAALAAIGGGGGGGNASTPDH